ncbi:hypothetical protein EJ02DRAFT_496289 [Clathrospora elynae]|uniref:Uncharacterized protein n=1 Tax=Clathrospora elynae TaxID=706981 RepID=A0A6A5SRI7_9PLEO|nr:hypothetical protein EJ02DRAFT_496289 [Clathrospora elynae]
MASHGKVLDLLNDGYLELQDVAGNVEPLPTLVPYEQYAQNVLVYRMDTPHDIFMALIQDFTERTALETGKELWTWCVQWEIEHAVSRQPAASPHSPKKPRLALGAPDTPTDAQRPRRNAPPLTAERRVIDPELMLDEDMLRILIDIVQVDSCIVPNFIEFLYRWIDFYEGDGKALKAALQWEIPSLWDFEYHPLMLPEELRNKVEKAKARDGDTKTHKHARAEDLAQSSPTKKMREKPDIAAMERQTEESERLQYREVHFGIQPPKLNEPLPRLINVPLDGPKRIKYYAACFRSRQRALNLLIEAGINTQQIKNYKRMQKEHPRDTPQEGEGGGLKCYHKDAAYAQTHFVEKEKQMLLRNKQVEITISNKLAAEAQLAARSTVPAGSSGIPLIPSTPSYAPRPDMAGDMLRKIQAARGKAEERINVVPASLVGKMKSKLFNGAQDRQAFLAMFGPGLPGAITAPLPPPNLPCPSLLSPLPPPGSTATFTRHPYPHMPNIGPLSHQQPMPGPAGANGPPIPINFEEYMRNLTPEQAARLLPLMHQQTRQMAANRLGIHPAGNAGQASTRGAQFATSAGRPPSNMLPTATTPQLGFGQAPRPSLAPALPHPRQYSTAPVQGVQNADPSAPQIPRGPIFNSSSGQFLPYQHHQTPAQFAAQASISSSMAPSLFQNTNSGLPAGPSSAPAPVATLYRPQIAHQPIGGPTREPSPHLQNEPAPLALTRPHPPSPNVFFPPGPGITRNAPSPLTLMPPPPSPLSSLAPSLLATSPFASPNGIPIQIYFPRILIPGNTIGPGGKRMGNSGVSETDAFLVGHAKPGSGNIVLNKAIFLPVGVWENTLRRVRRGKYVVLETYPSPMSPYAKGAGSGQSVLFGPSAGDGGAAIKTPPHQVVYEKLRQAYGFMASSRAREHDLTKRWRVTKGPMTLFDRGAVWEGWAVTLDRGIGMCAAERRGSLIMSGVIDEGVERKLDAEEERRRREMDELLAEDEDEEMDS